MASSSGDARASPTSPSPSPPSPSPSPGGGGDGLVKELSVEGRTYKYYDVTVLGQDYERLPYCLRIMMECMMRRMHRAAAGQGQGQGVGGADAWKESVKRVLDFKENESRDVLFHPGRVLLQDFTGVPALVDLAAVRDAVIERGGDAAAVDSLCPADLVVDHSVQLDYSQVATAAKKKAAAKAAAAAEAKAIEASKKEASSEVVSPTMIVHSTFPPPATQYYATAPDPSLVPFYPTMQYQPMYATVPTNQTFYSVAQYAATPQYYPPAPAAAAAPVPALHPPSMPQTSVPEQQQWTAPGNEQSTYSEPSPTPEEDEIPTDNPGLPIQDEVCPFHHRISYWSDALRKSQDTEFRRNEERFAFLKWVNQAFRNITVIPPGTGIMHQVNLEYLSRVVTCQEGFLFPDSLVGTDSHTTVVNGLGVLGWGVGTLDAESVMFGHPISVQLPKVVGCKLVGSSPRYSTSTELVLLITKKLRSASVAGCFVEFFGPGVGELSVADRATIANMCPEYGALVGFFPTDEETLRYLSHTCRDRQQMECIREYLRVVKILRVDEGEDVVAAKDPEYSRVVEVDLSEVQSCLSGPKRARDKVPVEKVAEDFRASLTAPAAVSSGAKDKDGGNSKGFGVAPDQLHTRLSVDVDGSLHSVSHGSIVLAAISSCSNTSNPSVMLGAGLMAKKAIEAGLSVRKYIRTSLSPGSGVVTSYLHESGVMPYLYMLGFEVSGFGCSACVGNNKRPLASSVCDAIGRGHLVCCGVLSGNRNFEGRIQPEVRANYLASPLLVIAYAIAGRIDIDFEREPLGRAGQDDKPVFLRDLWPTRREVRETERRFVTPAIFRQVYARISYGNKHWSALPAPESDLFPWEAKSTFIQPPLYIEEAANSLGQDPREGLKGMRCLLKLGDNVTSDHISPAGR